MTEKNFLMVNMTNQKFKKNYKLAEKTFSFVS